MRHCFHARCLAFTDSVHSGVYHCGSDGRAESTFEGLNLCIPRRIWSVILEQEVSACIAKNVLFFCVCVNLPNAACPTSLNVTSVVAVQGDLLDGEAFPCIIHSPCSPAVTWTRNRIPLPSDSFIAPIAFSPTIPAATPGIHYSYLRFNTPLSKASQGNYSCHVTLANGSVLTADGSLTALGEVFFPFVCSIHYSLLALDMPFV